MSYEIAAAAVVAARPLGPSATNMDHGLARFWRDEAHCV